MGNRGSQRAGCNGVHRADVNQAIDDARESRAALIGCESRGGCRVRIARADRGAAAEQGLGFGGPAVVLQGAQPGREGEAVVPVRSPWAVLNPVAPSASPMRS